MVVASLFEWPPQSCVRLKLKLDCADVIRQKIARVCEDKDKQFANARIVDNLFQVIIDIQETRLASKIYNGAEIEAAALALLTVEDCEKLLESKSCQYGRGERRAIGFGE